MDLLFQLVKILKNNFIECTLGFIELLRHKSFLFWLRSHVEVTFLLNFAFICRAFTISFLKLFFSLHYIICAKVCPLNSVIFNT